MLASCKCSQSHNTNSMFLRALLIATAACAAAATAASSTSQPHVCHVPGSRTGFMCDVHPEGNLSSPFLAPRACVQWSRLPSPPPTSDSTGNWSQWLRWSVQGVVRVRIVVPVPLRSEPIVLTTLPFLFATISAALAFACIHFAPRCACCRRRRRQHQAGQGNDEGVSLAFGKVEVFDQMESLTWCEAEA